MKIQQTVPLFLVKGFVNLNQLFSASCQCCTHGWNKLENLWNFLPWATEGWPRTDGRPGSIDTLCLSCHVSVPIGQTSCIGN